MILTALLSLAILCAALAWSIVLLRRLRDWRITPLSLMIALATLRQGLTLQRLFSGGDWGLDAVVEPPGLLISALMLLLVATLDQLLGELRRARFLSERTPDIIFGADGRGRLIRLNDAFERLTGWPRRAWLSRPWIEMVHPEDRPRAMAAKRRLEAGVESVRLELRVATRWGGWLWGDFAITGDLRDGRPFAGILVVARDITDLKQTEAELRRSDAQLRGLTDRLRRSQRDQESRIQRHLHDELAQLLSSLKIDLARLAERLTAAPATVGARVASMRALLDAALRTVRRFAADLDAPLLEDMGLAASIEAEATALEARSGCRCALRLPPEPLDAARDRDRTVLQVVREIFDNIAQHAAARSVSVRLSRGEHSLELEVCDDGVGIDPDCLENGRSLGVAEMRECARAAGGRIEIQPLLKGGTVVRLSVPETQPVPLSSAI